MADPKTEEQKVAEIKRQTNEARKLAKKYEPIHREIQAVLRAFPANPQR